MWMGMPIADLVITLSIYLIFFAIVSIVIEKKVTIPFFLSLYLLNVASVYFNLQLLIQATNVLAIGFLVGFITIYAQEIRRRLASRLGKSSLFAGNLESKEQFLYAINDAVMYLSNNKIGALITIEKKDALDHYSESGEIVNAPLTSALLKTIFYVGTALHDGAVIIRKNTIAAASVYFTPSVKPLIGKFGARHRAALGISEVTDSVTIIVSEETGRISFAKAGELISIGRDNFLKQLEEYIVN
jgi:diadenylate cyclase